MSKIGFLDPVFLFLFLLLFNLETLNNGESKRHKYAYELIILNGFCQKKPAKSFRFSMIRRSGENEKKIEMCFKYYCHVVCSAIIFSSHKCPSPIRRREKNTKHRVYFHFERNGDSKKKHEIPIYWVTSYFFFKHHRIICLHFVNGTSLR